MKKKIEDLEVILLYLSKVKGDMGLDYYLVKNNLSLPEKTIPMDLSLPQVGTPEYIEKVCYVYNSILSIIQNFSDNWKKIGKKKVKILLNTQDLSSLFDIDSDKDGKVFCTGTSYTIPFNDADIAFFVAVGLESKKRI